MKRPVRITLWVLGAITGLVLLLSLAAVLILPSDWFREKVRSRIVYEIEKASGGRVEIGAFKFDWGKLNAEITPFVLHGTEPPGEAPLFRAESVQVGLKIISAFKRDVDIASVIVDRPQLNLILDENGITNFPKPADRPKSDKDPVERLLDLAIGRIFIKNGEIRYADRKIPLNLDGENLNASLDYNFNGPNYQGTLGFEQLKVDAGPALPMAFALDSRVALFKNRIDVQEARLRMKETQIELAGVIEDFRSLKVDLDVQANGAVAELGKPLRIPEPHVGTVQFKGKLNYGSGEKLRVAGRVTGQGLAVRQAGISVTDIAVASDLKFDPDYLGLTGLRVDALDGRFDGMFELHKLRKYEVNGKVTGLSVEALSRVAGLKDRPFSGFVSGPVEVEGTFGAAARDLKAAGRLDVTAGSGGVPIKGFVEAAYSRRGNTLQLGKSFLTLPSSRVEFSGTLGSQLAVRLQSTNLNDFTPVIASIAGTSPEFPLQLQPGGAAVFAGTVTGPIKTARVAGDVTIDNFKVQQEQIDRLVAKIDGTSSGLQVTSFALGQGQLRADGTAEIGLQEWKLVDSSAVAANLKLQGAEIAAILSRYGRKEPIDGLLSATVEVQGTKAEPKAVAQIVVEKPSVYGERLDRARAQIRYTGTGVEVIDGVAEMGSARLLLSGAYQHPVNDLKNGRLNLKLGTKGFTLQEFANVRKLGPGLEGRFDVEGTALIGVRNGELSPQTIDGKLAMRSLVFEGKDVGDFSVDASTQGQQLTFSAVGNLRESKVTGRGTFQLADDYPGSGRVDFSALTFATLQDLAWVTRGRQPLPFDGVIEGQFEFSGPAKKPEAMRARLELPTLRIVPARRTLTGTGAQQLSLRNASPLIAEYDGKQAHIKSAHFIGPETDLRVSGAIGLTTKSAYDLRVIGNVNLGILRDFNSDIVSSGAAIINASVRGSLNNPNMGGRMELKKASFYITDIPNGLDNANGTIVFDERRATIEKLTAQTGGGDLVLSGFFQFGRELTYSLQSRADSVRIRYPEGVSTTANATLTLTGSTARSLLSGVVTIRRVGFNPRTDIGGLLAQAKPTSTPTTPSEFLRGMQFDVRIETIPNLQFQTALTQDLQAEAELRLRGTAAKPVLLGRVVVNQGEIQFFGNKYLINRGEIGFFNPVKIEPVLDMDLETRVRGVQVNINFSGSLSKLNVSYRSDPPLQSTEIIALLAVGRVPGTSSSLASGQTVSNQSFLSTGTNSLLGQAVAAPVSSRLQRFFGVSRLKIDPQFTGVNAIPQARLTIEQQISRDITLTYITNLSQANQQIIRLEWDINRNWSVVALREENGVFGMDFFYKKRF